MKRYVAAFVLLLTSLLAGCGPVSSPFGGIPAFGTSTVESTDVTTPIPTPTLLVPRLTLRAEAYSVDGYGVRIIAEIVGGTDYDPHLYCAPSGWDYGDGQVSASDPYCRTSWKDTPVIRFFESIHLYDSAPGPRVYPVTFHRGRLQGSMGLSIPYTGPKLPPQSGPSPQPTQTVVESLRIIVDNWPAEHKLVIDPDTVARFNDPDLPRAQLSGIAVIDHIPSASTVTLALTDSRLPGEPPYVILNDFRSPEGQAALERVLRDEGLFQEILARSGMPKS